MKQLRTLASALCIGSILTTGVAVAEGPVAWCTFDSAAGSVVADRAADRDDRVEGNYTLTRGAVGNALLFDGFTTVIDRPAADAPRLNGDFSVEDIVKRLRPDTSDSQLVLIGRITAGGQRFPGSALHGWRRCDEHPQLLGERLFR